MPTMTTASSSTNPCHAANALSSILHNDLDLLGDRVLYTEGVERLEYWKAFEVRTFTFTFTCAGKADWL